MSSMLEQAVMDATALKNAALKNAEQLVLEKYAPQIKQAVNTLLEQDDEELESDLTDISDDDAQMDDMMGGENPTEDPLAKNLSLAATEGETACSCPDEDEEIEINFDELAQLSGVNNDASMPGQMDTMPETEDGLFMEEDASGLIIPAHLGPDLHMYHMSMSDPIYKVGSLAYAGKKIPADLLEKAITNLENISDKIHDPDDAEHLQNLVMELQNILSSNAEETEQALNMPEANNTQTQTLEEVKSCDEEFDIYETLINEFELNDNEISELAESLEVAIDVVPHGHAGHATTAERIESEQMQLAKMQDTKFSEEMSKLNKAISDVQKENQSLKKQLNSIILENKGIKKIAFKMSEKLNELNVQNAQLVYKNRALESVSLNERQRKQIVEAISKVDSIKEAKVVFETLNKSFMTKEEAKPLPRSLNEAIQKSNGMFLRSTETTESNNPYKERLQRLAGILKNS